MINKAKNFKAKEFAKKSEPRSANAQKLKPQALVERRKENFDFYPNRIFNDLLCDREIQILRTSLENANRSISELILKPRVNLIDIQIKTNNELKRKEQEASLTIRNIEEKLDSALDKANKCLEGVYNLGKRKTIETNYNEPKGKYTFLFKQS